MITATNNTSFNLIRQSVVNNSMTDNEKLLEEQRVTCEKKVPPMEFLFRVFGKPCFPRGELVGVTGKAKSGKTLFNSMLMACCVREEVLQIQRPFEDVDGTWQCNPIKCLWYDTEQSEQSTQEILTNRILRMVDIPSDSDVQPTDYYDIFNVRCLKYKQRLDLFEMAVKKYHPDLVMLDGLRDLMSDINNGKLAQIIIDKLMALAQEYRCCIVCVLHQNKGGDDRNLRGWIGTELTNKAFEVYSCEKLKPENVFVVEQTLTRKYDWDDYLCFRMDSTTELPVISEVPTRYTLMGGNYRAVTQTGEKLPDMNREWLWFDDNNKPHPKTKELFCEALKMGPLFYSDLQSKVQQMLKCGTDMWNNTFRQARDSGMIVRVKNQNGKTVWQLPVQQPVHQPIQQEMFNQSETD